MKLTEQKLKQIISEERVRAICEFHVPWSKEDFFSLLNESKWYEKLDPKSTAYKIAMAAAKEWDAADEKSSKRLAMTRDDYMKAQVYANAQAPHKFSRFQDYEREGSLPQDDPRRTIQDIVRKGYPKEKLIPRKTTPDTELEKFLSKADKAGYTDKEIETWVSPFGYMHALVPDFDKRNYRYGLEYWVYTGEYYPDVETGKPASMELYKRFDPSHAYPRVTLKSLALEREAPAPNVKQMTGKDTSGSVDVQDPTMEEQLINAVREQLASLRGEQ